MSYQPRNIVNGALLKQHMGKDVSIFLKIDNVASAGTSLVGKSSDDKNIQVTLTEPLNAPLCGWVEVIGTPTGTDSVRCKEIILFEQAEDNEEFDTNGHNMMILFWMNCQDIYKTS